MKKGILVLSLLVFGLTTANAQSVEPAKKPKKEMSADEKAEIKKMRKAANADLSPEQKLDGLVQDYVKFMNEDLKFVDPRKGVKYVKKYHDQNRSSMDKILSSSEK